MADSALILHELRLGSDFRLITGSERTRVSSPTTTSVVFAVEDLPVTDAYGTATLWTTGNGGITTFRFGLIVSNQDIYVEFRTDNGTPDYILQFIPANVPVYFGGRQGAATSALIDGAVFVDGTDDDDVDRIKVQRNAADGEGDALISLYLFN